MTVRPIAYERGSALTLTHEGPARTIVTDARRVRQILLNLLSNAIKFGEGRPITVVSRALEAGGVEVEVTDQGIGIAAEDLPKIFDEFVQLRHAEDQQGTGLGLPISQRLAHLLEGELQVTSAPGTGSTFRLMLPATIDVPYAAGMAPTRSQAPEATAVAPLADAPLPSPLRPPYEQQEGRGVPHPGEHTPVWRDSAAASQ